MADEIRRKELGEKIKEVINRAIRESPELKKLLDEMSDEGYRISLGILIGIMINQVDDVDAEESADFEDEEFWHDRFSAEDIAFLKSLDLGKSKND